MRFGGGFDLKSVAKLSAELSALIVTTGFRSNSTLHEMRKSASVELRCLGAAGVPPVILTDSQHEPCGRTTFPPPFTAPGGAGARRSVAQSARTVPISVLPPNHANRKGSRQ